MLRYSIVDETLYGTVAKESFSMKAYSGGGRGSTSGLERTDLAHWSTRKKAPESFDRENRGGPLPSGHYVVKYIGRYKHYGECARLEQTLTSLLHADIASPVGVSVTDREGFLIHSAGPKGSDGCIVPASKDALKRLLSAVNASVAPVLLEVHSEGVRSDKINTDRINGNRASA